MKRLIFLLMFMFHPGLHAFTSPAPPTHTMDIHGWVFNNQTGLPVPNHWVYFKSYNNNTQPQMDSSLTSLTGHYHFESIVVQNTSQLNIDVYTFDCQGVKETYHSIFYEPFKTYYFYVCVEDVQYCHAEFSWLTDPLNSHNVQFTDHSQGNINYWSWDFGDGNSSGQPSPHHTYPSAGNYRVILRVKDTTSFPPCMSSDTQNITIVDVNYYNLAGQVFGGFFPQPEGIAVLYLFTPGGYLLADSCNLNSNGVYYFYHIPEANYLVKILGKKPVNPDFPYWPTYLGDIITWTSAQVLHLQADYFQADIHLQPLLPLNTGPGKISGTVLQDILGTYFPVLGVEVILFSESGTSLKYTYSDEDGNYSLSDIPFGTYLLKAEVPGINLAPVLVTLTPDLPEINNVSLFTNNPPIGFLENDIPFQTGPVFPNPSNGQAEIEVTLKKNLDISLIICNILGIPLGQQELKLLQGKNILKLPLDNLDQGSYLITLLSKGNYGITRKIELIR